MTENSLVDDTFTISLSGDALADLRKRAAAEGIELIDYVRRAIGLRAFFQDEITANQIDVLIRNNSAGKIEKVDVLR